MSKIYLGLWATLWAAPCVQAQLPTPNAEVSIGTDKQVYYSLKNGNVKESVRASWDLAFQIGNVPSTVLANVERWTIYKTTQTPANWDTPLDTAGLFVPANILRNSESDWYMGAFSRLLNPADPFDPGWGAYNPSTHVIEGNKVFLAKGVSGTFKKIVIEKRYRPADTEKSTYRIRIGDLDGSNTVVKEIQADAQVTPNRMFVYYDIASDATVDVEPHSGEWELLFTKYVNETIQYPVSGVLLNPRVRAARVITDNLALTDTAGATFTRAANTLGDDWKAYDMQTGSYRIADTLVFFLTDEVNLWRVVFTGFGSNRFSFEKVQVGGTQSNAGLQEAVSTWGVYPNPTDGPATLVFDLVRPAQKTAFVVRDVAGRIVASQPLPAAQGFFQTPLPVLPTGVYFLTLSVDGRAQTTKLVVR
jgi:hypothetical protein